MAAACLCIIWHQTFWRLYLCVHISRQIIKEPHVAEKQKVTWKVTSASSEVTCAHDKRLKQDADPQLCLPPEHREHLYRSSLATGGAVSAWNAGWPKALLTVCRLWGLTCFDLVMLHQQHAIRLSTRAHSFSFTLIPHIVCKHYINVPWRCRHTQRQAGKSCRAHWNQPGGHLQPAGINWAWTRAGTNRRRKEETYGTVFNTGGPVKDP